MAAFNIITEAYCKRYYHEGYMSFQQALEWSQKMLRGWYDETEAQILWELEEPPESNIQMATDILRAYEYEPNILSAVIDELVQSANNSVLPFLDQFLSDLGQTGAGGELRSVGFDNFNNAEILFDIVSLETIRLWQEQGYMYRGDRYALI